MGVAQPGHDDDGSLLIRALKVSEKKKRDQSLKRRRILKKNNKTVKEHRRGRQS